MSITSAILSIIDEIKEDIPNNTYIKLCNRLQKIYIKEKKNEIYLCSVKLDIFKPDYDGTADNKRITFHNFTQDFIIKITKSDYEMIINNLEEYSTHRMEESELSKYFGDIFLFESPIIIDPIVSLLSIKRINNPDEDEDDE
jgi:hypothetical protein